MPSSVTSLIDELNEEMLAEKTTCQPQTPFIALGTDLPPKLNYNIPQTTSFTATGFISITKDENAFKDEFVHPSTTTIWDGLDDPTKTETLVGLVKQLLAQTTQGKNLIYTDSEIASFLPTTTAVPVAGVPLLADDGSGGSSTGSGSTGVITPNTNPTTPNIRSLNQILYWVQLVRYNITQGKIPVVRKNLFGDMVIDFVAKPVAKPELFLAIHYKVQSFLGNYGAGKVIKTMSLLPGEKTTITVKTYKDQSSTQTHSDNVLDSFTQNSSNSLEKLLETEHSESKTKTGSLGFGLNIPLAPKTSLNLSGNASKTTATQSKTLNRALDKHVEESQAQRKLEVNKETTTTNKEGEENSIVRELKNINVSRVLNFTFRQMNQEYIVVTYIDDVSLVFADGIPENAATYKLYELDDFLSTYLKDDGSVNIAEIKANILNTVYNFRDNNGQRRALFVPQTVTAAVAPGVDASLIRLMSETYWGKDEHYIQAVPNTTFTVPGIITQIEKHVLSTDSLITEALLGKAEALDCYNIQIQQEAVNKEKISNLQTLQQISKIENLGISNADIYKQVYNTCCDEKIIEALHK